MTRILSFLHETTNCASDLLLYSYLPMQSVVYIVLYIQECCMPINLCNLKRVDMTSILFFFLFLGHLVPPEVMMHGVRGGRVQGVGCRVERLVSRFGGLIASEFLLLNCKWGNFEPLLVLGQACSSAGVGVFPSSKCVFLCRCRCSQPQSVCSLLALHLVIVMADTHT